MNAAEPAFATPGCGFDSAGDYTCRSVGNLRTPSDPGMPNIPGYSGPGQDGRIIPPRPLYTPGDLVPGLIIPFIPEFPPFVFPILVPLPGVPIIPIVLCNPVPPVNPQPPIGPVTPGGPACGYPSAAALVMARENPAFGNLPDDARVCSYQDSGAGCGDAGGYNAVGPGIRLGCNPGAVRMPDGSAMVRTVDAPSCTTKALVMEAWQNTVLPRYQADADSVVNAAQNAGNPICNECMRNVLVSMDYRGDLHSIPGFTGYMTSGNYQAALEAVRNQPNVPADRRQDMIDGLNSIMSSNC